MKLKRPYKTINILLILTAISLLGYLAWDFSSRKPYRYNPGPLIKKRDRFAKRKKEELKPISHYLSKVNIRNIFLPYQKKIVIVEPQPEPKPEPEPEEPKIPITDLVKNLRIVGFSDNIVMIENSENGSTLFLQEGDTVNENLTIKSVQSDSVVISDGVEETKLTAGAN